MATERPRRCSIPCLGLVAALSVAVVVGGFQFAAAQESSSPRAIILEENGAREMTSTELQKHLAGDKESVYWLGSIQADEYAIDHLQEGVVLITYLEEGSDISNTDQLKLTVETYSDSSTFAARAHSFGDVDDVRKSLTANGNTVEFNTGSMEEETVRIKGTPQIVVIHYSTRQSVEAMMKNADDLKLGW